jgi:hypothetical protein
MDSGVQSCLCEDDERWYSEEEDESFGLRSSEAATVLSYLI